LPEMTPAACSFFGDNAHFGRRRAFTAYQAQCNPRSREGGRPVSSRPQRCNRPARIVLRKRCRCCQSRANWVPYRGKRDDDVPFAAAEPALQSVPTVIIDLDGACRFIVGRKRPEDGLGLLWGIWLGSTQVIFER
jgi:hypothetical protein